MGFVQTAFLITGAAIAVPIAVHLLSRLQVRRLELGTMRFLREVVQDGAQSRKIRRWLLLLTRMALVALLSLLFARPFFPERVRGDGDRTRIVLIDRSASMGMPGQNGRLVDDAVDAAIEAASAVGPDARVVWAWFDQQVNAMPPGTTRPSAPRAVMGDTDYAAALRWARDRAAASPGANTDLVLVTDLQQSGLAGVSSTAEGLQFPDHIPVRVIDVGRPAANNLAITSARASATRLPADRDLSISATLFNYGTLDFEDVPLAASAFNGSRTVRLQKYLDLPGGQAEEVEFDFGRLEPGTWRVTIAVDVEDDLAVDNRRLAAVELAEPVEVLVLDSGSRGDAAADESFFVAAALGHQQTLAGEADPAAASDEPVERFRAQVAYLQDTSVGALDPEKNRLVVVANSGALSSSTVQRLSSYVRRGGKLLVFAGDGSGGANGDRWQQSGLAPGQLQAPQRSGAMPFRIVSLRDDHTMLHPFEDPQHGDLGRLAFRTVLPVSARPTTEILASFEQGRPALTQHSLGEGRVVWFLTSADSSWGDWTSSPLYLPLVQQMAADLLSLTGEGPIRLRTIGQDAPLTSPVQRQVTPVKHSGDDPNGAGDEALFSRLGFEKHSEALYVVNAPAKESDPARINIADFADHFGIGLADGGAAATAGPGVDKVQRHEIWPWLAAAFFVLLVAEFGLANRTPA